MCVLIYLKKQEGIADPALKPDFYIFSYFFNTNECFLVQCKPYHLKVTMWHIGDKRNILCEYEVNLSTNEKVITEKQDFNTNS